MLELAVASKAHLQNNSQCRGAIHIQPASKRSDTEQYISARVLENWAKQFLALSCQQREGPHQIGPIAVLLVFSFDHKSHQYLMAAGPVN
jgi:hypothetical protein